MTRDTYRDLMDAAARIEGEWRRADNRCEVFPEIAWKATEGLDLVALGDLRGLTELLRKPAVASLQHASTFSDLYFKLFDNGRFWIEVLNWWGSDINVHDHNFSGVQFQLTGHSLNVVYAFREEEQLSNIKFGQLDVARAELWKPGARSIVQPGTAEPHNVSHLDVPTVSLLVRTHPVASFGHQNNYLAPDIAANYGVADIVFRKRIAALRLLSRGSVAGFQAAFRSVLASQTRAENLFTFAKTMDIVFAPEHAVLLAEYVCLGSVERRSIQAVANHLAQDCLTNVLKYAPGLDADEILLIAMLAASHDQQSFESIRGMLAESGEGLGVRRAARSLRDKLDADMRVAYDRVLNTLHIDPTCPLGAVPALEVF